MPEGTEGGRKESEGEVTGASARRLESGGEGRERRGAGAPGWSRDAEREKGRRGARKWVSGGLEEGESWEVAEDTPLAVLRARPCSGVSEEGLGLRSAGAPGGSRTRSGPEGTVRVAPAARSRCGSCPVPVGLVSVRHGPYPFSGRLGLAAANTRHVSACCHSRVVFPPRSSTAV